MRARKPKHIPQRLAKYCKAIETNPFACAGSWTSLHYPSAHSLHVDLGCGKGSFVVESAKAFPDSFFIGIDVEDICIALAAQKAVEAKLDNAIFVIANADEISRIFASGEVDVLHLNFCTPRPKAKHAPLRLTYFQRLVEYKNILNPSGHIAFKTDSQPFFDWSLTQFKAANYKIENLTRDLHATNCPNILTEYEGRLSSIGAKVHACNAFPLLDTANALGVCGKLDASSTSVAVDISNSLDEARGLDSVQAQKVSMSLGDYLPKDLESMEYVPYGMEDFVRNKINWLKKHG